MAERLVDRLCQEAGAHAAVDESNHSIRLCNLRDPRSKVDAMGLSPAEERAAYLALGFRGKPSDRGLIDSHVEYVFSRDPTGRRDRFSKDVAALYSALDLETARREMRHHARAEFFKPAVAAKQVFTFSEISLEFDGRVIDLRAMCAANRALRSRTVNEISQRVGLAAGAACDAILVSSVRHDGTNQVTFNRATLSPGAVLGRCAVEVTESGGRRTTRLTVS